jgi:hypothetical protein
MNTKQISGKFKERMILIFGLKYIQERECIKNENQIENMVG